MPVETVKISELRYEKSFCYFISPFHRSCVEPKQLPLNSKLRREMSASELRACSIQ